MVVEDGLYAKGDDDFVDQVAWVQGLSKPIKDNQNVKLVYVEDLLPKQAKLLNDVRGLVISDFQESLQNQWVDELRSKYTVVVNAKVLGLLKDNRLHELEDSVEAQEIPKYTGSFGVAFRSAINDLGSSKSIMFQWNNKNYTTELK